MATTNGSNSNASFSPLPLPGRPAANAYIGLMEDQPLRRRQPFRCVLAAAVGTGRVECHLVTVTNSSCSVVSPLGAGILP